MRKLKLKELNRISVAEFKETKKAPIVLVLDNIRSALNVGSAFRTADAFTLKHIYLCGITARPPHREILKTAIGATDSVDWTYFESTLDLIRQLKEKEYQIIGVEQAEGSIPLQSFSASNVESYALIFGNEVSGVSDEVMNELDACIEIPQFGTKHSLNVAVSMGIVIWDFAKESLLRQA